MLKPYQYVLDTSIQEYINENIIELTAPVTRIGIQAHPGTKFILNGSKNYMEIGYSGIYELNLGQELGLIYSLVFTETYPNDKILVDIIYQVQNTETMHQIIYDGGNIDL